MAKINFKIVTPEKVTYQDQIDQVTIPTADGEITVHGEHMPLVSLLKAGELKVKKEGREVLLAVSSGFVEIRPKSEVIILADTADRAEELDEQEVAKAKQRAEDMLKEKDTLSDEQFAILAANLDRELARFKVVKKYKNLQGIRTSSK
mgnify:CR=1 FL=1